MWWGRWDLNPGSRAPQARILVQARRRPHVSVLRHLDNGKIIHALIKFKSYACKENQYSFSECKSIWLIHKHFNSFDENDNVRPLHEMVDEDERGHR